MAINHWSRILCHKLDRRDQPVISSNSAMFVKAGADQWGTSASNGGIVILTADGQSMTGDMVLDSISSLTATLKNSSSLTGGVNTSDTAKSVVLYLDATSNWNVTSDSYVTTISDSDTSFGNIISNGHTVCYRTSVNGDTIGVHTLSGGGKLKPCS